MKKILFNSALLGLVIGLLMGCILQDEDCLDDNSCGDQVVPTDSVPVDSTIIDTNGVDTLVACYEIYAPVCAEGNTYPNDCYAEAAGHDDYQAGSCDNPVDSLITCPTVLPMQPTCGVNEYADYSQDPSGCGLEYKCVPIEGCQEIDDSIAIDCREGAELRLVRDEAGCSDYQCVTPDASEDQCNDVTIYYEDYLIAPEQSQGQGGLSIQEPIQDVCVPVFNQEGCVVDTHCGSI